MFQPLFHGGAGGLGHLDGGVQILALLLQGLDLGPMAAQGDGHLMGVAVVAVVQIQHVLDLLQGEADAAAPQDQFQPGAVAGVVDAGLTLARGRQQALVLIEPKGARRGPELAAQLADGIGAMIVGGRHGRRHNLTRT
jgi:hypothetical protein